ncbi:protein REVEILLE 7-like [Carya illinoinensis]|uniref:protein REVEILLE 7-like n=1 Tax=Carya illinoinensis TaxID=32201 RepID=UPI001C726598|nr:protein REVEILLE 7-like [Carya illinoinensis]
MQLEATKCFSGISLCFFMLEQVRKPYTIVKQKEKWTKEEHQKFIEALRLFGRGWRQIKAHVGTKIAVQIRSHAKKFFSKVVRASNSNIENSIEPVEIPPPWPKKKRSHPYDFNSFDSPNGISLTNQTERSPLPNLLVAKEGTKSTCSCDDKVVYFVVMDVASCILI